MEGRLRIILINPKIPDYRIPVFQALARMVDLTVLHSGSEVPVIDFKQIIIPLVRFGPFRYFSRNIHKICKEFDIVISEGNIRHIDRDLLILNPFRSYKWICWGIGVTASYTKKFDSPEAYDFLRYFIFKHADANIFYSAYPLEKYIRKGFNPTSLFVAHNTTVVSYNEDKTFTKSKILFVGTLYKQKKIFELLESYHKASKVIKTIMPLDIIGDGDDFAAVKKWITNRNLDEKVNLLGSIYDHAILEMHFRSSYACISPGQAGLSVLTSMGYGTPYITMNEAITGGEIFNIVNNENGILYKKDDDLTSLIIDINTNPTKYLAMGARARKHYLDNRRMDLMLKGFSDAIEFVSQKRSKASK